MPRALETAERRPPVRHRICCFALLSLFVVTGCALTPKEVTEKGTRRTAALRLPPQQAALCIERNAENRSGLYIASHRPFSGEAIEVTIRFTEFMGVLAVAHLRPEGTGSAVEVWISPNVLVDASALNDAFIANC